MEPDPHEVDRIIAERFATLQADNNWQPDLRRGLTRLHDRRTAGRRRGLWMTLAAGTLAACLPIMAFPVTRALARRCVTACVAETSIVRQLLLGDASGAKASSTFVVPRDRRMAPEFRLPDESGRPVRLSDFRGKVVLLSFWATWCSPCEKEVPWFIEFQRENAGRGFTTLGVSMDSGGWPVVSPWTASRGVNYPVMIGNSEVAALFGGLESIPLTVLIDRSGRIAAIHAGLCRKDEYVSDLKAVLDEKDER